MKPPPNDWRFTLALSNQTAGIVDFLRPAAAYARNPEAFKKLLTEMQRVADVNSQLPLPISKKGDCDA